MTKPGRQTRLYYRAHYFRRGFADVANPAWVARLSEEEQGAYRLRESFRAVHRDRARTARKSNRFRMDEGEVAESRQKAPSSALHEVAGEAFAEYVRLLKNRRGKAAR